MAVRLNITFRDQACSWFTRPDPPIGVVTAAWRRRLDWHRSGLIWAPVRTAAGARLGGD